MPSFEVPGLRQLHHLMRRVRVDRCSYAYRDGRAEVTVAFLTDERPYALLIVVRGPTTHCFERQVHPGYRIDPFLGEHFGPLKEALGISGSTGAEPWGPIPFFTKLGANVPLTLSPHTPPPPPELIAQCRRDVDEADKIYFVGWKIHTRESGRHVTAENLEKTRRLLHSTFAEHCERSNISSVWTDDPARSRRVVAPSQASALRGVRAELRAQGRPHRGLVAG